jgi:cell division protein FtsI/penicillin-binding protein 2
MSRGFASNYRVVLLASLVGVSFVGLGARLVQLHVIDRERLLGYVVKARREIIVEKARRGDILDARGNILATSKSQIVLGVDPQALREKDEPKWAQLAAMIDMPLPELRRIFATKTRPAGKAVEIPKGDLAAEQRFNFARSNEAAAAETEPGISRTRRWTRMARFRSSGPNCAKASTSRCTTRLSPSASRASTATGLTGASIRRIRSPRI